MSGTSARVRHLPSSARLIEGTMTGHDEVGIGWFACAFGDVECKPENIPDFDALWQTVSFGTDFAEMGCTTYRKMSGPVEEYVVDAVRRTLQDASVSAADIDDLVFATSDPTLALLPSDFAGRVLIALGLDDCVPHVLSFQRCCSSLTALRHGRQLFADPGVTHVLVVALDFVLHDRDRVRSYAMFGDAVVSCLLTRHDPGLLRLVSSAVHVDRDGLRGQDSFISRKNVADRTLSAVLRAGRRQSAQITKVFAANLHKPLTLFNATSVGLRPDTLHFADTLAAYGHCGNADWMINLADYHDRFGIRSGETYLAQSLAPGFYACGLLEGSAP
jgi:3-oxoacyl-[acyl-carrier-protein] synthase III